MSTVDNRVSQLVTSVNAREVHSVLGNRNAMNELKKLHDHFVVVSIDKASSNIYFVCKKYYAECIKKELGYAGDRVLRSGGSNSQTYEHIVDANPADIIENHVGELASFGLEVEDEMKYLPGMYGSPKLHKCPIVLRYIISSKRSSLKPLLKDLTSIFKLFQKQIKGFNDKRRLGSRVFQNSQPLIDRIEKINKCNKKQEHL